MYEQHGPSGEDWDMISNQVGLFIKVNKISSVSSEPNVQASIQSFECLTSISTALFVGKAQQFPNGL